MKSKIRRLFMLFFCLLFILSLPLGIAKTSHTVSAQNEDGAQSIVFELDVPSYSISKDADLLDRVEIAGFEPGGKIGNPQLPNRVYNVALPPDTNWESVSLEVVVLDTEDVEGEFEIAPVPPPVTWDKGTKMIGWGESAEYIVDGKNTLVYESDSFYPSQNMDIVTLSQMRKWNFAKLVYRPVKYNPLTGKLKIATKIKVSLSFQTDGFKDEALMADTVMDNVAAEMLMNYEEAKQWYSVSDQTLSLDGVSSNAPSPSTTYVIITTNAIESGSSKLANFITHKQSQGYTVMTITEDEYGGLTGQSPNGTAEKIRKWLIDNYVSENIEYVLLIGDPDPDDPKNGSDSVGDVPMKMLWPREHATTYTSYDEAPSDYFYADLTGNWNLDGDSLFGEYDGDRGTGGVDFSAEVYVGRIPVYGASYTSLDSILQKIIDYETASSGSIGWRESALLPMSFSDSSTDGAYLAESMMDDYLDAEGYSSWTMYQQGSLCTGANSSFSSDEELHGNTAVKDRWSANDYGIVNWWGHGGSTSVSYGYSGCGWGTLLDNTQTSALDDSHPSFVYQCSCLNGYPENSGNLGYSILENGGIGTVSASRVSWYAIGTWSPMTSVADNASIGYYWHENLVVDEDPASKALYQVKSTMGTGWGDQSWMNLFDFNLYGDPSTSITASSSGQPDIDVDPESLANVQPLDDVQFDTLTIFNLGNANLDWEFTGGGDDIVGEWEIDYDWNCDGSSNTATITFAADGTFTTSDGYSGTWTQNGDQVQWVYDSGTTYDGTISGDTMSGTMVSYSGLTGCWGATRNTGNSIVGDWTLNYDWNCDGSSNTATITFAADGTFTTSGGGSGTWTQNGDQVQWVYDNGTTYDGTISGDTMSGTMVGYTGSTGCWDATRIAGSNSEYTIVTVHPSGLNASGEIPEQPVSSEWGSLSQDANFEALMQSEQRKIAGASMALGLVNDGSFENGPPPASAWTETADNVCEWIQDPTGPWGIGAFDGTYAYWAGGYCSGVPSTDSVTQDITVPVEDTLLSFWYVSYRIDDDDPSPDDFAYVSVNGTTVWEMDMTQANETYPDWVNVTVDLSAYADQVVSLKFGAVSVGDTTGNILFDYIEFEPGGGCTLPANIPWLNVDPTNDITPSSGSTLVDITYDSTGLSKGSYNANLCIASNDPDEALVVVPVTLDVGGPPIADFDGDGMSDPAKFYSGTGTVWWLASSTGSWDGMWLGGDTFDYVTGDFDGDGMTDPAKFYSGTGTVWWVESSTGTMDGQWLGADSFAYISDSDFDGDGKTDPAKFYSGTGTVWWVESSTGTLDGMWLGGDTFTYVPGSDFDGDGKTDPAKFYEGTGTVWWVESSTGTMDGAWLGGDTFTYVPRSDFDGDGKTDPAKFYDSTGTLWWMASSTGTLDGVWLGPAGTFTVVGGNDFDGDGITDPAKFDASTGTLSWLKSSTGTWDSADLGTGTYDLVN